MEIGKEGVEIMVEEGAKGMSKEIEKQKEKKGRGGKREGGRKKGGGRQEKEMELRETEVGREGAKESRTVT